MNDGGYEDGYISTDCFWGKKPGKLVTEFLSKNIVKNMFVLDLGCGEGKNAAAFAERGAIVTAIDCSEIALRNGKRHFPSAEINWICEDGTNLRSTGRQYDIVIMYGILHCLQSRDKISAMIANSIDLTKIGGHIIVVAFNDGPHDLSAHPNFRPTLLPHIEYANAFKGNEILFNNSEIIYERHPHNCIDHFHSITRLVVRKM